jgi:GGDEF domain-containing protein
MTAARRTFDCACIALLCALALGTAVPAADAKKPRRTISRELNKLYLRGAIDEPTYAADRALYQAKREGKDCVVLFPGAS